MEYKKITIKDIEQMLKLDERFESRWSAGLYADRLSMFPELAHGAFDKGTLIGFVIGKKDPFGGSVIISRLVVHKRYEKRGIGGHLVDLITKKTAPSDILRSTVRESNLRSVNLHKHRDFKPLHGYHVYQDGEKGIRFLKRVR